MSESGLTDAATAAVDEIVSRTEAPSLVAGVVRDGAIVHLSHAGTNPTPAPDLQYRLGSITKSLTAAVVLELRDAGKLDLDDPIGAHLPMVDLPKVRLRQLLGQAGGLQREPDGPWWERNPGRSLADLVAALGPHKVAFRGYQRFHYSNLAYGLLGGVVERLTLGSWWDAVSTRLLAPLGMARTTYLAAEPFARGYVVHPVDGSLREEPREDAGAMAPAGQLWSTARDLARWASALTGHHPSVVSPSTVDEMASPVVISDPDSWRHGYGLGLQLWRCGERVYIGHTGSMPGYLAITAVHRRSGTGVVALANCYTLPGAGIAATGLAILDAVLDATPPRAPSATVRQPPAPPEAKELLGTWWWMGQSHTAHWLDGELVISTGREDWAFVPEGPDRWRGRTGEQAGEVLAVLRSPSGEVAGLDIATFVFRREPMAD